jgi:hypothetical protein
MTWYTHVNKNIIARNVRTGANEPAVKFQRGRYGKPTYRRRVRTPGPSEVIQDMRKPILPCGARLVIASEVKPEVVEP